MYISRTAYKSICTFNTLGGNLYRDAAPDLQGNDEYLANFNSQAKIIRSELNELHEAVVELIKYAFMGTVPPRKCYDLVRDGIADVCVTTVGMFHRLGIDYDDLFGVHEAYDCNWLDTDRPAGHYRFDQLPLWAVPRTEYMLEYFDKGVEKIQDTGNPAECEFELNGFIVRLSRILYWMTMISRCIANDLEADLAAVNANNLAKFTATPEDSAATVEKFAAINVTVEATHRDDGYIVHRVTANSSEDEELQAEYPVGKLVKPINFEKVVLPEMEVPELV